MVTVSVCSKLKTSWKSVAFTNKVGKRILDSVLWAFLIYEKIIPLALVGYEMIIAISALRASFANLPFHIQRKLVE